MSNVTRACTGESCVMVIPCTFKSGRFATVVVVGGRVVVVVDTVVVAAEVGVPGAVAAGGAPGVGVAETALGGPGGVTPAVGIEEAALPVLVVTADDDVDVEVEAAVEPCEHPASTAIGPSTRSPAARLNALCIIPSTHSRVRRPGQARR